jgi:phospho-N-acetylmuramoyl-pentapeptide-transferase
VRAALAGVMGLVFALGLGFALIPQLRRLKLGQPIRDVGPARHQKKAGTPTMGGIIFVLAGFVSALVFDLRDPLVWGLLVLVGGHSLIGFVDDYRKVVRHQSLGLRAREKLVYQILLAVLFAWFAARYLHANVGWSTPWGAVVQPGVWYYPLVVLAVLGSANAVNITDGLDGLAGGAMAIALVFFVLTGFSIHLDGGISIAALAFLGAVVGFLRYNLHPARVIMGDTGALALGALLAGLAVASRTVFILPILGGLFVLEALSVIAQVTSFKLWRRRVLKMSPLHHHFELSGWSEERVVATFWATALVFLIWAKL